MKTVIQQITFENIILVLFGLFPILPNSIKGLPVFLLVVHSIIRAYSNKKQGYEIFPKNRVTLFFIMASVYLFYMLSIISTENFFNYWKSLETSLSLLVIPLSFLLSDGIVTKKSINYFKKVYLLGVSLFSISCFSFILIFEDKYHPRGISDVNFIRLSLTKMPLIDTHPIYASIYFGIGILILLSMYKTLKSYLSLPILILMLLGLSLLASKMAIIALVVILVLYIIYSIHPFWKKILSLVASLSIVALSIIYIPYLNFRFKELYSTNSYSEIDKYNSTSIRNAINSCAFELLESSWLVGDGIGDVQSELNECYESKSQVLLDGNYNSHNQYLSIWLGTGIIGLIAFLFMLFYNFRTAWRQKDLLFMAFLLFYMLNFLTENVLERQSGVILFAFMINLFGFYNFKKTE